ncbi:MAG: DNA mismatch repair endonuclease MutL [Microcoleus sp. PH2017_10_PVI_O_A]|uniref:DNA mismatch repair endonuclease MutL n=1 Tax=unclassified Microcoleus TaxID=2642155 RepID=UPI001D409E14|nr:MULTISPECIES: DNA mismatch repair endonuclease MutL [unclassified Microcoleus]TAE79878.1 MAG: DNA mismatch repair endonuclease MutL [Oscillatoriales cyanobacterium]MCC3407902.1 DNA mismatch repair endonuclease MutL [Microcoleus sp. PH2017_10_PVI_O_A]MCC3462038.1 DNA mismatch repair endonuclease MutL [Microcoleus sp. PH2017_11_PCY_U_A]MCC3480506.1 DNA mismatch repair endonuclease MutL [Microcoleus sp. PH2017_12_PCY_D_A]MCC3532206.1 DNA mismatch repair endonuclease MutL [Microcoleus sp. PH201
MPVTIQALPAEVIDLIAAGEVIDSIAAAVRELVENSLDAGATRIVVSVWPEQWRVQVADNGTGMDLENLQQAASPHSTSKITTEADLYKIATLGFRGEALHSLAQLGCLEVLSRPNDLGLGDFWENRESGETPPSPPLLRGGVEKSSFNKSGTQNARSGWRVVYNNAGVAVEVETAAIAPGTVVTVANLFGNWPVRRTFLSPAQQMRSIQSILQQIAICHPHVNWQLRQANAPCFYITSASTAEQILPQFVRGVRSSDLQYLKLDLPASPQNQKAANFLVEPQLVGATNKHNYQFPMPNSRCPIPNSQSLELVIGLPDRCHRSRPDWVKVAVNRRVVRSPEIEQTILSAFARTCGRDRYPVCFVHLQLSPSEIDWNRHPAKVEIYLHDPSFWQAQVGAAIDRALHLNDEVLPDPPIPDRVGQLLKASEQKSAYSVGTSARKSDGGDEQATGRKIGLMELRAIAQVHNTYIVAEHSSGMWLVEQHIAHERVLYERICADWQLKSLEKPVILSQLSALQIENLSRLGLEVESFGEQLWAAREVPDLLVDRDDCADALFELSKVADLQAAQVATACRSAIRNGTPLNLSEMQNLLDEWQQTRNPRTCPHGRPIYFALEESTLARIFRRSWVIGKSHGI